MRASQRGAALLVLMTVMITAIAIGGAAAMQRMRSSSARQMQQVQTLALAADALRGKAFQQRCLVVSTPVANLLPCPDSGTTEGTAAAACPGTTQGWLPWRTLGLPPLRDNSGTCLWYERQGATARIIAAGSAQPGQSRTSTASRPVCGGNNTASNYIDATDVAVALTLDSTMIIARCP